MHHWNAALKRDVAKYNAMLLYLGKDDENVIALMKVVNIFNDPYSYFYNPGRWYLVSIYLPTVAS